MGKCVSSKKFIEICLDKDIVSSMDTVLEALNKQLKKGEHKFTRSMLINDALCLLFTEGAKIRVRKSKEEKQDA